MRSLITILSFIFLFVSAKSQTGPRLMIDPQGHSGIIKKILVTKDESKIISISKDKSIRIYDYKTGKVLKTLRTQIGNGWEGALFAAAVSPDSRLLAVGGFQVDDKIPIFVIDLEQEKQIATVLGHKNVIQAIEFSVNGDILFTAGNDKTIKVWDVNSFDSDKPILINTLKGHEKAVFDISVGNEDKEILTASQDGTLRCWKKEGSWKNVKSEVFHKNSKGFHKVETNFDGLIAAIGLDNKVLLFNKEKVFLKNVANYSSTVSDIAFSQLNEQMVVFSKKGEVFSLPDCQKVITFDEHDNLVTSCTFSGDGNVVSAGGNAGDIFIWQSSTGEVLKHISSKGQTKRIVAFGDQESIAFGNTWRGDNGIGPLEYVFDFKEMKIYNFKNRENEVKGNEEFVRALTSRNGISISKTDDYTLTLSNRKTIKNNPQVDRKIKSFTFTQQGQIIVGSSSSLKLYDNNGKCLKKFIGHIGTVWAIAASKDGRLLASASKDQTIKLWDINEKGEREHSLEEFKKVAIKSFGGENKLNEYLSKAKMSFNDFYNQKVQYVSKPLVTLFVDNKKEWVCYSPEGYYASSNNAYELVGWHINKGLNKLATYHTAGQLFDKYYRPDIIKDIVGQIKHDFEISKNQKHKVIDIENTLKGIPIVKITSPNYKIKNKDFQIKDGILVAKQNIVNISMKITSMGKGIKNVHLFHNGKLVQSVKKGLNQSNSANSLLDYDIELVEGVNAFKLTAANNEGTESIPDFLSVKYESATATPNLHIFTIGIDKYSKLNIENVAGKLQAQTIEQLFSRNSQKLYGRTYKYNLYNQNATQTNINAVFDTISKRSKGQDVFIFYFSGKNMIDKDEMYLLTAGISQINNFNPSLSSISMERLTLLSKNINAHKQLFIFESAQPETCFEMHKEKDFEKEVTLSQEKAMMRLARNAGITIIGNNGGKYFLNKPKELSYNIVTQSIVDFFSSEKSSSELVAVSELQEWLNSYVPKLTKKYMGVRAFATAYSRARNFYFYSK